MKKVAEMKSKTNSNPEEKATGEIKLGKKR
jgi:hypothetical protein